MDAPTSARGSNSLAERRALRRERLLAAGVDLFTSQGYAQTRTEQLASHAGMSLRNFYEEFSNKEGVLLALHESINSVARERVLAALATSPHSDLRARLKVLIDTFFDSVTADPRVPHLNYVEAVGVSPAMEQQHRCWVSRWAEVLETEADRAADAGFAPARPYRLSAVAIVGAITALVRDWQYNQPTVAVADVAEESLECAVATFVRPSSRE